MQRQFASDNQSGICPEAWEALAKANVDHAPSYGDDRWTKRASELFREQFETDCDVFFTFNGTAANALALAGLGQSYHGLICHESSHVATAECGAPEFFSGGMKLLTCPGDMGKLAPMTIQQFAGRKKDVHAPKARVLSLTQATETGAVYSPAELAELCGVAKAAGIRVHMDGARFANAVASLGCRPADITWKAGVDVLCCGGTKNGMAMGEAIVFFDRDLAAEFDYRVKQGGQLASKMRFIAAQWAGMLSTGAWLRHASHANAMAKRLEAGLQRIEGVRVLFPVQANGVFVELPPAVSDALRARGWVFYLSRAAGARLMCSWDTTEQDVDQFIVDTRNAVAGSSK